MDENYNVYRIKRGKKYRCISEPKEKIRPYLDAILKELTHLYTPPEYVHGFIQGKNTYTNALPHCNKPWIATADIKDFFPSTSLELIFHGLRELGETIFERNETPISFFWLKEYCFFTNRDGSRELSQGSPCSPILCNVAFIPYDKKISKMCEFLGISYTRYADDLTFSVDHVRDKVFLSYLVDTWLPKIILPYKVHPKKVKFRNQHQRQEVTGLIVNNEKPRPKKEYRNTAKVIAHKHKNQQASQAKHNGFQSYLHIDSPNQEENQCQNYKNSSRTLQALSLTKGLPLAMARSLLRVYLMCATRLCATGKRMIDLFRYRQSKFKVKARQSGSIR